jgi:hypothetical protein
MEPKERKEMSTPTSDIIRELRRAFERFKKADAALEIPGDLGTGDIDERDKSQKLLSYACLDYLGPVLEAAERVEALESNLRNVIAAFKQRTSNSGMTAAEFETYPEIKDARAALNPQPHEH